MMPDSSLLLKKVRHLSQALLVSGVFNIGVLALLSYWIVRESPPTPYCELKPATYDQQQIPLADHRSCGEVIKSLRSLSFDQLIAKLYHTQLIENGYTERDLALSCLIAFYHFDISRALPKERQPPQQRILMWKDIITGELIPLSIYPGLTDHQFKALVLFAKTERWPMTPLGLFSLLQKQKVNMNIDPSLVEAFMLTPEFLTVELLFNRVEIPVRKQRLLEVILEGNWPLLQQFVNQQRQLHDLSAARYQKFLLDYIANGSAAAAYLFLDIDGEFAVKKLNDAQVIIILQLLAIKTIESERFALALLTSPRSTSVWQQASLRLYEYAGEPIPQNWDYKTSLQRFVPEKLLAEAASQPASRPSKSSKISLPVNKPVAEVKLADAKSKGSETSNKQILTRSVPPPYRLYIVQEGDSLWKISRRFGVDMNILKERNQLQSDAIRPGIVLKIP